MIGYSGDCQAVIAGDMTAFQTGQEVFQCLGWAIHSPYRSLYQLFGEKGRGVIQNLPGDLVAGGYDSSTGFHNNPIKNLKPFARRDLTVQRLRTGSGISLSKWCSG
jgi:hypothetical protein